MFFDDYSSMLEKAMDELDRSRISEIYAAIDDARNNDKRVFILGNGGSAAAASHWVCDFGKGINDGDSKRLKIMAPSDNSSILSALGNDCGYETTFMEQLKNFLEPGDLVISLSVSGNSPNLVESHEYARSMGAKTICIVGDTNGKLIGLSDTALIIPSKNYGVVEDLHIILEHAMSQYMKKNIIAA